MDHMQSAEEYLRKKKIRGVFFGGYHRVAVYETISEAMRLSEARLNELERENEKLRGEVDEMRARYAEQIAVLKRAVEHIEDLQGEDVLRRIAGLLGERGVGRRKGESASRASFGNDREMAGEDSVE